MVKSHGSNNIMDSMHKLITIYANWMLLKKAQLSLDKAKIILKDSVFTHESVDL